MAKYNSKKQQAVQKKVEKSQDKEYDKKEIEAKDLEQEEIIEDSSVTDRLAISHIDFDKISLPLIFKVFESFVGDQIVNISLFQTDKYELYAIAKFTKRMYAKKAYEMTEGLKLEDTYCTFDLSFVPDDFVLDKLIDSCTESVEYEKRLEMLSKNTVDDESMIDISDEKSTPLGISESTSLGMSEKPLLNIPEITSIKEQPVIVKEVKEVKQVKEKKGKKSQIQQEMHSFSQEEEEKGFEFDISDKRFQNLLDNDDFIIDASNNKSKKQKATSKILQEKRKRVDLE
ncbi:hypothetical protein GINT2_000392 [Glugoides intestinalis]